MGGGRDFLGNRLYRRIGGKYERIRPYKKDYDALIDRLKKEGIDAPTKDEMKEILRQFGYRDEQLKFVDQVPVMRDRQEMSVGMAKMAMAYGTDMIDGLSVDGDNMGEWDYAHAHIYNNERREIHLNPSYYVDGKNHDYKYDVESGFHPKGMDNEMLVEHEYAHMLQRRLSGVTKADEERVTNNQQQAKELRKQADDIWNSFGKLSKQYEEADRKVRQLFWETATASTKRKMTYYSRRRRELWDKMWDADNGKRLTERSNLITKAMEITKSNAGDGHDVISGIFAKIGAPRPVDVATRLTGRADAYASKNWSEAHAECVADYMRNGKNASPISIAYVREMNKYFKGVK